MRQNLSQSLTPPDHFQSGGGRPLLLRQSSSQGRPHLEQHPGAHELAPHHPPARQQAAAPSPIACIPPDFQNLPSQNSLIFTSSTREPSRSAASPWCLDVGMAGEDEYYCPAFDSSA